MSALKYRLAAAPFRMLDRVGWLPPPAAKIEYIVERIAWSIAWDGQYICNGVNRIEPNTMAVSTRPERFANCIVHFGSHYQWLSWRDVLSPSNRYVATFYHGKREDGDREARVIDAFVASAEKLEKVVTACGIVHDRLLQWGVPAHKIARIPIPIDVTLFKPVSPEARTAARRRFGIPEDTLVVGSFQKDGNGWGEGREPKLIKGPDVLVDAVARVHRERPVFVALSGPARGYVKARLDQHAIPYVHIYESDYRKLPELYAALDIYINPSREEGGPKGILEAMASGIPVVSTEVGMAPDLMTGIAVRALVPPGNAIALANAVLDVAANADFRSQLIVHGHKAVVDCDWPVVAAEYYELVYRPLLQTRSA